MCHVGPCPLFIAAYTPEAAPFCLQEAALQLSVTQMSVKFVGVTDMRGCIPWKLCSPGVPLLCPTQ